MRLELPVRERKKKTGRSTGADPVVGSLAMAIGYTVVMGWILKYTVGAFTGATLAPADVDEFSAAFGSMASAFGNTGWQDCDPAGSYGDPDVRCRRRDREGQ